MNISSTSSSTSSNGNANYSRITGLATGLDTDGLVKQALTPYQTKIDSAKQDLQYTQWQQEAYVGFITDLKDFSNYFDITKPDNMMLSSAYNGSSATATLSNGVAADNYLTASTLPGAIRGNYQVKISNLAEGAKASKDLSTLLTAGGSISANTTLGDLGVSASDTLTITVDNSIPSNPKTFKIAIDPTKKLTTFVSDLKGTTNGDDSLLNYVNINLSELTNKLTIETRNTGTTSKMSISSDSGKNLLGLVGDYTGKDANLSITAPGETTPKAVVQSSNNFTIDNVTYNLVSADPNQTINLNVKADASAQVDKIKKFIDKYNTLIDKINTKLNEKKSYDYKPLTDAQRSSMKDTEITNWETKAKEGILSRDGYLSSIVTQLRQAVYDSVKGAGISLTELGITTTSNYMDGGKLTVDDAKLKSALEQRGDMVQTLFTKTGTTDEEKGIFQRFKSILNNAVGTDGSLIKKAGYTNTKWVSSNDLSKKIAEKNTRINDIKEIMAQKQQSLYSMYATLEQNMNNLNSQSSWLASSLGAQ